MAKLKTTHKPVSPLYPYLHVLLAFIGGVLAFAYFTGGVKFLFEVPFMLVTILVICMLIAIYFADHPQDSSTHPEDSNEYHPPEHSENHHWD